MPRTVTTDLLRAGSWPPGDPRVTLTPDDLAGIARSYRPDVLAAPVIRGHDERDGKPAGGWVRALRVEGDRLVGEIEIADDLAAEIAAGHYRQKSVALLPPGHWASPEPDTFTLRHLAVLGAEIPAVHGLAPLQLTDAALERPAPAPIALATSIADVITALADRPQDHRRPRQEVGMTAQDQPAAPEHIELAARLAALEARERELAERERRVRRAELERTVATLTADRRLAASQSQTWVDILDSAGPELAARIVAALEELPPRAEPPTARLSVVAGDAGPVEFAAPPGVVVPQEGLQRLAAARRLVAAGRYGDVVAAAAAISRGEESHG